MKIHLKEPDGPYSASIDTEVMQVNIYEAFIGATFITSDGERLVVMMRDSGFELVYYSEGEISFRGEVALQNGNAFVDTEHWEIGG